MECLEQRRGRPITLYDRLTMETKGFTASYDAIKRFAGRVVAAKGISAEDVGIPVMTLAGEVARVDFGEVPKVYDSGLVCCVLRRAWVFEMARYHSRHQFCRIVFDQGSRPSSGSRPQRSGHHEVRSTIAGIVDIVRRIPSHGGQFKAGGQSQEMQMKVEPESTKQRTKHRIEEESVTCRACCVQGNAKSQNGKSVFTESLYMTLNDLFAILGGGRRG